MTWPFSFVARTSLRWETQLLHCRWNKFIPFCNFFRTKSVTMKVKKYRSIYSAKLRRRKSVHWNNRCCSFVCAIAFVWLRSREDVFASPLCSLVRHNFRVLRITKYVISGLIWAFGRAQKRTTSNCEIQTLEAQKTLQKSAFDLLNPRICVNQDINKQIKQNYFYFISTLNERHLASRTYITGWEITPQQK